MRRLRQLFLLVCWLDFWYHSDTDFQRLKPQQLCEINKWNKNNVNWVKSKNVEIALTIRVFFNLMKMKKFTGQFRHTTWDPFLIISQIIALQAVFYLGLGAVLAMMSSLEGSSRSLDHLFKYQVGRLTPLNAIVPF